MLNVSTFGNTADIYAIVHLVPHACQHNTVYQNHSSGDTVAKTQTGFIPEFHIPLLDTVENRCCLFGILLEIVAAQSQRMRFLRIPKHKMTAQVY